MINVKKVDSKIVIANALQLGTAVMRELAGESLDGNHMNQVEERLSLHLRNVLVNRGMVNA